MNDYIRNTSADHLAAALDRAMRGSLRAYWLAVVPAWLLLHAIVAYAAAGVL